MWISQGWRLCCKRFCNFMLPEFSPNVVMQRKVLPFLSLDVMVMQTIWFCGDGNTKRLNHLNIWPCPILCLFLLSYIVFTTSPKPEKRRVSVGWQPTKNLISIYEKTFDCVSYTLYIYTGGFNLYSLWFMNIASWVKIP